MVEGRANVGKDYYTFQKAEQDRGDGDVPEVWGRLQVGYFGNGKDDGSYDIEVNEARKDGAKCRGN